MLAPLEGKECPDSCCPPGLLVLSSHRIVEGGIALFLCTCTLNEEVFFTPASACRTKPYREPPYQANLHGYAHKQVIMSTCGPNGV